MFEHMPRPKGDQKSNENIRETLFRVWLFSPPYFRNSWNKVIFGKFEFQIVCPCLPDFFFCDSFAYFLERSKKRRTFFPKWALWKYNCSYGRVQGILLIFHEFPVIFWNFVEMNGGILSCTRSHHAKKVWNSNMQTVLSDREIRLSWAKT